MDFSKLGQAAAETEDQSVEKKSARAIPKAGVALLRFREYIELGRHKAKNPQHKPAFKTILVFELLHPNHMIDTDDGKVPMTLTVRVNKTATTKGSFLPLFNKMNYDGDAKHMVQMLGKPFLGKLFHKVDGEKTYVNLFDTDGSWHIGKPEQVDALTEMVTPVPVPEMRGDARAFLWENAGVSDEDIKAMWESIYIDGTREDDDGSEKSKNWIQETIMQNLEWEGSRTQSLVEESVDTSELTAPEAPTEGTENAEAPPEY